MTNHMKKDNLYTSGAKYYDFLVNKKDINKEIQFISKLLHMFMVKSVLDLGCGTGLYSIPLKKKRFDVEGLDFSKDMLKELRKKTKKIKLYNRDMSDFKINKKYDSVICLSSSLLALPNFKFIKKTLKNIYKHLNEKGILILDLPNHTKEIRECNNTTEQVSYITQRGKLESTFISYKKRNEWIEEWYGILKKDKIISKFKNKWKEFIYSPKEMGIALKKIGFKIVKIYGSMKGTYFDKHESYRRVYICQKK